MRSASAKSLVAFASVHPVPRERSACCDCFGAFVGVVRKHEVGSATVEVEPVAEDPKAHGGAFDVPTRPSSAPGSVPRRFTRFATFPQGEVEWVFLRLVDLDSRTGAFSQLIGRSMDEVAVPLDASNAQVHA